MSATSDRPSRRTPGSTPPTSDIAAEMVASVLTVAVETGSHVETGDTVIVLESMKMEIPVLAERPGTVTEIGVVPGDVVQEGDVLVRLSHDQ